MIHGELLNLRAVERMDAALIHRWFNDPTVMRWWGVPEATSSLADIQRRIEDWIADEARLDRPACFLAETLEGEMVGLVILKDFDPTHRSIQLSLMIGESSRWGQGLGSDLVRTVVDASFDAWNLHRVWLRSEAGNERAHSVYRKCGFMQEAVLREAVFFDGRYHDVLVFSILEDEWREAPSG
jgi:RimJ/RimL family protein N-acetyltransferase